MILESGNKLRQRRRELGLRADYVFKSIGVSRSTLLAYENGTRRPKDDTKIKLAELYGTTVSELFFS